MKAGLKLQDLSDVIYPYPTYTEALGRLGTKQLVDNVPDWSIRVLKALSGLKGERVGLRPDEVD